MRLLLLALASIQVAGCAPRTRSGATIATVAGAALTIGGAAMLADAAPPDDRSNEMVPESFEFLERIEICDSCDYVVPVVLLAAGLILGGSGVVALSKLDEKPDVVAVPTAPPAPKAIDSRLLAPLPAVPTDDQSLQMAKQARGAARRGDCDAAGVTLEHIRERDPRYARALAGSVALAPCR